ncbi:MAG: hypothetical protein IKP66_05765 [Lachnospiraceae bacterium]|nr:hypothetical protein [Lachnospiraceae bacterium]
MVKIDILTDLHGNISIDINNRNYELDELIRGYEVMKSNTNKDTMYIEKEEFDIYSAKTVDGTNLPNGTLAEVYEKSTHEITGYYEAINGEWYKYKPQEA